MVSNTADRSNAERLMALKYLGGRGLVLQRLVALARSAVELFLQVCGG